MVGRTTISAKNMALIDYLWTDSFDSEILPCGFVMQCKVFLIHVILFTVYMLNLPLNTQRPFFAHNALENDFDFGSWQTPDISCSHLYRGIIAWTPPTAIYREYTVLETMIYSWFSPQWFIIYHKIASRTSYLDAVLHILENSFLHQYDRSVAVTSYLCKFQGCSHFMQIPEMFWKLILTTISQRSKHGFISETLSLALKCVSSWFVLIFWSLFYQQCLSVFRPWINNCMT